MTHPSFRAAKAVVRIGLLAALAAMTLGGCAASEIRQTCTANCSDAQISDAVRAQISNSNAGSLHIAVSTIQGVVYLHGTVNTSVDRKAAFDAAREVPGVVSVVNSLEMADSQ